MDDKKIDALPVIDKAEFDDDEFPDLMNNKRPESNKEGADNE